MPGKLPPLAATGDAKVTGFQKALQKLGFDPGKIDGIMGPKTEAAVKKFQQANALAADGIVGPKTQAALAKAACKGSGGRGRRRPAALPAAAAAARPSGTRNAAGSAARPPAAPTPPAVAPSSTPPPRAPWTMAPWQAARLQAINELKALAGKVAATKHADAPGVIKEISTVIGMLPPKPAPKEIDKLAAIIRQDDAITAAEECPKHFHDVNIRKPLLAAARRFEEMTGIT